MHCPMCSFGMHHGMFFPFIFMIICCIVMFFIFRCCFPFSRRGDDKSMWSCCFPGRSDSGEATESDMAKEISKLREEIQELKDNMRRNL